MSDLYARPDHWTDALPQSWQQSINTNPLLNALGRALNRQPIDLERAARDTYGTPEQQAEADRQWLIQKAQGPSWLERNPTAADGVNKLGMLANFLGPGVKLPSIRGFHGTSQQITNFDRPVYFSTSKDYASRFGSNVYEADIAPANPHFTNVPSFVETLRSFPERAAELRRAGHDAVILSGAEDRTTPIMGLGGMIEPQIYVLDPSIIKRR